MAKLIQICASQNDLFALDEEGKVYQYKFNTKTWEMLHAEADTTTTHRGPARKGAN